VIGSVITAIIRMGLLWICAPRFLTLSFKWSYFRPLFGFGSAVSITNIISLLAQRLDVLIIGRLVGSAGVGLYQRALQLALLPLGQITGPVNKVLFPAMSSVQDEPERFRRGYLSTVRGSTLVTFPILTILWGTGDIIIPFVYGPMWEEVVPILQVACVSAIFRVLTNSQGLVAQAQGRAKAEAVRQFVWLLLVALFGVVGSRAGVFGVVIGVTLATFVFFISMTQLALPLSRVPVLDWLKAIRAGALGCTIMGLSIVLAKSILIGRSPVIMTLFVLGFGGLAVYVGVIRLCLSVEDAKLAEVVSRMLPSRIGILLRSILGIKAAIFADEVQANSPA
jgi:O-antigen/teichoic acid export membrane protein